MAERHGEDLAHDACADADRDPADEREDEQRLPGRLGRAMRIETAAHPAIPPRRSKATSMPSPTDASLPATASAAAAARATLKKTPRNESE